MGLQTLRVYPLASLALLGCAHERPVDPLGRHTVIWLYPIDVNRPTEPLVVPADVVMPAAETTKAIADPSLQTGGQFGTPTVVANGAMVDLNNTDWLKAITG